MDESPLSQEDLVALRDGLRAPIKARRALATDRKAAKQLAESRLFALLVSMSGSDASGSPRTPPPSPEMLARYLDNALPWSDTLAIESRLRTDARAFALLVALKDGLFDTRWSNAASPPPHPTPPSWQDLGVVRWAFAGQAIRFRRLAPAGEPPIKGLMFSQRAKILNADVAADTDFGEAGSSGAASSLRTEELFKKADLAIDALRAELRELRARARQLPSAPAGAKGGRDRIEEVLRSRLKDVERELRSLTDAIREGADGRDGRGLLRGLMERIGTRPEAAKPEPDNRFRFWPTSLTLTHPDLEIDLHSINTDPTPMIGITVRPMQGAPSATPEATLVVPGKRFVALAPGPEGTFKAPPPSPGTPTLLLIDTDRTYSIRLEPA
jgi:hypothetical protein